MEQKFEHNEKREREKTNQSRLKKGPKEPST